MHPYRTNARRSDGFGAQFQSILWSMLYADMNGYTFTYTPPTHIEHMETDEFMKVSEYICFEQYRTNNEVSPLDYSAVMDFIHKNIGTVFRSRLLSEYLTNFYKNKQSRFDNSFTNVSIHIRRPSESDLRLNLYGSERHLPNSHFLKTIDKIRSQEYVKPLRFHIYSIDKIESLREFESPDTVFHSNDSTLDSFNDLIFSDILVTSKSSFSYIAALISKASIVYYTPFWHPPIRSWIVMKET